MEISIFPIYMKKGKKEKKRKRIKVTSFFNLLIS